MLSRDPLFTRVVTRVVVLNKIDWTRIVPFNEGIENKFMVNILMFMESLSLEYIGIVISAFLFCLPESRR